MIPKTMKTDKKGYARMSEAAKEWAAYVAARNAIETAKAARLAAQPANGKEGK